MYGGKDHVTASPRPPLPHDPVERDDSEALIEEARQRARRRRRLYGAAAAVLALLGIVLFASFGRPEPSQSAPAEPPALPIGSDDEPATIVAQYARFHEGWVVVYADGRVIRHSDLGTVGSSDSMFEARLTADGLDRVRSGAIRPRDFLYTNPWLSSDTWADVHFEPYELTPTKYAICYWRGNGFDDATNGMGRLPAAAQAVLRGKQRTYNNPILPQDPPVAPVECFEVSAGEATALEGTLSGTNFSAQPILPHGEWVAWAG
jgi:hypothetical protein